MDRYLHSHVVAYRYGYKATPDRPKCKARPKTAEEREAVAEMRRFYQAIEAGHIPEPDKYLGKKPVWLESTITEDVKKKRKPGRPSLAKNSEATHGS